MARRYGQTVAAFGGYELAQVQRGRIVYPFTVQAANCKIQYCSRRLPNQMREDDLYSGREQQLCEE